MSKSKGSITAIRKSLKKPDLSAAQAGLEKVQASAADAGSRDAAQLSAMLLSLLEIVSCFGKSKDDKARTSEIVSFVDDSLNTLQACLNGTTGSGAQETINVANREWGEYLELLPASSNDAWTNSWGGADADSESETFDASSVDMSALLAGLGEPVLSEPTKPRKEKKKAAPSRSKAKQAEPKSVAIPDPPAPEKPEMDADIVEAYADDATGCLASMEQCLLTIESDPSDLSLIHI